MNNTPIRAGVSLALFRAVLASIALASVTRAAPSARSGSTTYSAQATAVRIEGARNVGPIVIANTGSISSSGGNLSAYDSDVNIADGGLTIGSADAEADGSGPKSAAEARVGKFHVLVLMWSGDILLEGDYINASVEASVNPSGKKFSLGSHVTIQNLTVNGRPINVTGQANQEVVLPDDDTRLIINETFSSTKEGSADIQVVALHFWACDVEGRVGIVSAGITSTGNPPSPDDCGKVTGGGWIVGTPSGEKGTFGMSGGIRRGAYWGHLQYNDHGANLKVSSTSVTGFEDDPASPNGRIIRYAVTINGAPGTAQLRVVDNGEPGRNDIFDLTLSTGYHAGGELGGARPGGGNIQLHKCPPGWE